MCTIEDAAVSAGGDIILAHSSGCDSDTTFLVTVVVRSGNNVVTRFTDEPEAVGGGILMLQIPTESLSDSESYSLEVSVDIEVGDQSIRSGAILTTTVYLFSPCT